MRFSNANKKLQKLAKELGISKRAIYSFDLPAGHTCPGAKDCLSRANRHGNGIKDGPHTRFRCYAASAEVMYKHTREMRWDNLDNVRKALRRGPDICAQRLLGALPSRAKVIRIHTSGDFFSEAYMRAWFIVARECPDLHFYAYTKSLKVLDRVRDLIPANMHINISMGGKFDAMVDSFSLPRAHVVASELVALRRGLKVDTTDGIACSNNTDDFALVVHGTQPVGGHLLAA